LVVHSLLAVSAVDEALPGADYLAARALTDGRIAEGPHGLNYPVYTASLAVLVLSEPDFPAHRQACDTWLAYRRSRQLTEDLGWAPSDREYGGWGYSHALPRKIDPWRRSELLTESNLSATAFAVEALRAAGYPANDPAFSKALTFICRCQNYADNPDPSFDDGGFFFIYDDPWRNKAGVAGTDRSGRQRFSAYGSMTADGLRSLLACGTPADDSRVVAARQWLERHFSPSTHPGRFATGRAALQAGTYFYYCWSVARALSTLCDGATAHYSEALADELLRRQRSDSSWVNDVGEVREDDPLVATSFALGALAALSDDVRSQGRAARTVPRADDDPSTRLTQKDA
jgi:squalene-hopene/tetraprenyl-beta-curcumene cyclase